MKKNSLSIAPWLAQPRASWRAIDDVQKVVLYSRWSVHFALVFFAFLDVLGWLTGSKDGQMMAEVGALPLLTVTVFGLLCAGCAVAVTELVPHLNVVQRRPVGPFVVAALGVHTVIWLLGIGLYLWAPGWRWSLIGIFAAGMATICCSWGVLPWLKMSWLLALIVGTVTTAFLWREVGFFYLFASIFGLFVIRSTSWIVQVIKDLKSARDTEARLRVSEERLRFAQELHDTMGQHLAAISLKAQVARALAERNDARLDGELKQLQELAGQSSDEMRSVVRGYRAINLATELSGARELLESAGIIISVEGVSTDIPTPAHDLCAWLVRESATNILRHSSASHVSIVMTENSLCVENDGVNAEGLGSPGGLDVLRRKAEETGATLVYSLVDDRHRGLVFRLECDVSSVRSGIEPKDNSQQPSQRKPHDKPHDKPRERA